MNALACYKEKDRTRFDVNIKRFLPFLCTTCSVRKKTGERCFQRFPALLQTGDEGIEPPPKVLETPIIPLDQSPLYIEKIHVTMIYYKAFLIFTMTAGHPSLVFVMVKTINKFMPKKEAAPVTTKDCPYCKEKVALEATRCPHCTSELDK